MTRRFREKTLSSSSEKTVDLAIDRRESSDVVVKILTMVCALRFATQGACFRENCRYAHDAAEGDPDWSARKGKLEEFGNAEFEDNGRTPTVFERFTRYHDGQGMTDYLVGPRPSASACGSP